MFEILIRHYAVPIFIEITNMFFDLLMNSYLIAQKLIVLSKMSEIKNDTFTMTYPQLMLICLENVNISSANNLLKNKSEFMINDTLRDKTVLEDDNWKFYFYEAIQYMLYEIIKLLLLIFSLDTLAKCKTATADILKR